MPRTFCSSRFVANAVLVLNCFVLVVYGLFFFLNSLGNFVLWPAFFTFWIPFALAIIATRKRVSVLFFLEILASKERTANWVAVGANVVWLFVFLVLFIGIADEGGFDIKPMIAYLVITSPAIINILYLSLRSEQNKLRPGSDPKVVDAVVAGN